MPTRGLWTILWLSLVLIGCSAQKSNSTSAEIVETVPAGWTLINFGAPWCGICRKLEPELAQLARAQPNLVISYVDVDNRQSLEYQTTYRKYFHGRAIPYTVLVDSNGKARKNWVGYLSYPELVADILAIERNQAKETRR